MHRSPFIAVSIVLAGSTGYPAAAQEGGSELQPNQEAIAEPYDVTASAADSLASRISLDVSLRYTSDYFFRGIVQKTDSFNLQPSVELGFELIGTEDFSLSLLGGSWSNFSDDRADGASGSFSEYWYEHDAHVGVSASIDRLNIVTVYTWYFSPSSDFTEYEDLTISFAFDDSGLWDDEGIFSLNPSVSVAFETRNAAAGPDSGVWLGLGIEPAVDLGESLLGHTTLSFPVSVGLGLDNYYQRADGSSDTFGYAEVGAKLSFDLSDSLGPAAPALDVGASYLFLNGATKDFNGGDSGELVFSVGLSWSF